MKSVLVPLQLLALAGFLLSLLVHVFSIFGIAILPHAMLLHIGIFVVFAPAILMNTGNTRKLRMTHKEIWKLLLRGCPAWMRTMTMILFGYAFLNFIFFAMNQSFHSIGASSGSMAPNELRGYSGHWMIFYWISFAMHYSRAHVKGDFVPKCTACGNPVSPFDKFCPSCGEANIS